MLQGVTLRRSDVIVPVFVTGGKGVRKEVGSMPGVFQMSVDVAADWLAARAEQGFGAYLAFGVIERERKDATGSAALDPDNVVCRLLRETNSRKLPMLGITDLCFCEYTDHGHCGVLTPEGDVDNDATLENLELQAISLADAGAQVIAPSAMMDGQVGSIRAALDEADHLNVPILSYAAKYASAFYGPFRDAAGSAPAFGDRSTYQMDVGNTDEALREVELDVKQGADMIMIKPAMPCLDVLRRVRERFDVPLCAYQVSGEYSMIKAAAAKKWIDETRVMVESLTSIKRAGADFVLTYYAREMAKLLG
jgi:porphobilinogen synthase